MSTIELSKKEVDDKLKALLRTDIDKKTLEELTSLTKELFTSGFDTYWIQKKYAAIDSIVPPGKKYYRNIIKDKKGKITKVFSLTDEDIENHFIGKKTVGIPVINTKNKTKFLLYDLDGFENWKEIYEKVKFQFEALFNITPILEMSGRKDGYHIIVPTELTDAKIVLAVATIVMEHALAFIPSTPGHPRPKIGNDPGEIEIFPKQTKLTKTGKGQFGSMVKLPLGINTTRLKRSKFINPTTYKPYTFKGAVNLLLEAKESRVTTKRLKHIARLHPEKIKVVVGEDETEDKQATKETEAVTSKPLVEDDKTEDKSFNYYLNKQHFCIQVLYVIINTIPLPKDFKRYVARNFLLEGAPIGKTRKWFMTQPDYNKSKTKEMVEKVLEELITEIFNSKVSNPKDDSIDPENEELSRKKIRDDIKNGRYKSWKVSCEDKYVNGKKFEGLKTAGGNFLKKTICDVSCQSKKNSVNSLVNLDMAKSWRSSFIPVFQQIWKIIDIEKNRVKLKGHTYVHISLEELQTILDEHPSFCIKSTYHLMDMLIFMDFIETLKDGKRTFESRTYSGRKYRFNKDKIDDVINPN